ncbi:PQQ-binding-like beta-propeller repeat protein [Dactylosporangium sp. NBC_01737]|uniref:outer membrane protein assembly factor BamB family protein n=1 Tax=Dactylosporangium sp. NBC_01737 TaxID=2975959 RepID=UPI002E0E45D8|nr:PQQ-binding-like beta-propeller repeat protein [Dactylosporangium sp. NBC_01737]
MTVLLRRIAALATAGAINAAIAATIVIAVAPVPAVAGIVPPPPPPPMPWPVPLPTSSPAVGGGWTHDGVDAANGGYNPDERVVKAGNVGKLKLRWSVTPMAGAEGCAPALPPPLVAGGRVYVLDSEGVTALDAGSGRKVWRDTRILDSLDFRRIVVADGMLLVAGSSCYANSDPDGFLFALDAGTGVRRWDVVQEPPVNELVVDGGTVVTSGWATATNEDTVIAYGVRNGEQRWSRSGAVLAGPVSSAGWVLLHDAKGTTAVTVGAGRTLWQAGTRWTPLAATAEQFLAVPDPVGQGDQTGLAAIRAASGGILWRQPGTVESVATDGRRVYAAGGTTLTAFHAGKGSKLWSRQLAGAAQRPVRAGGLLYVTVEGHPMAVLSPVTGRDVPGAGRFDGATGHAVVTGGRLYLTDGRTLRVYGP